MAGLAFARPLLATAAGACALLGNRAFGETACDSTVTLLQVSARVISKDDDYAVAHGNSSAEDSAATNTDGIAQYANASASNQTLAALSGTRVVLQSPVGRVRFVRPRELAIIHGPGLGELLVGGSVGSEARVDDSTNSSTWKAADVLSETDALKAKPAEDHDIWSNATNTTKGKTNDTLKAMRGRHATTFSIAEKSEDGQMNATTINTTENSKRHTKAATRIDTVSITEKSEDGQTTATTINTTENSKRLQTNATTTNITENSKRHTEAATRNDTVAAHAQDDQAVLLQAVSSSTIVNATGAKTNASALQSTEAEVALKPASAMNSTDASPSNPAANAVKVVMKAAVSSFRDIFKTWWQAEAASAKQKSNSSAVLSSSNGSNNSEGHAAAQVTTKVEVEDSSRSRAVKAEKTKKLKQEIRQKEDHLRQAQKKDKLKQQRQLEHKEARQLQAAQKEKRRRKHAALERVKLLRLTPGNYRRVVVLNDTDVAAAFAKRVAESQGLEIKSANRLWSMARFYGGECGAGTYSALVAELHDAAEPSACGDVWVEKSPQAVDGDSVESQIDRWAGMQERVPTWRWASPAGTPSLSLLAEAALGTKAEQKSGRSVLGSGLLSFFGGVVSSSQDLVGGATAVGQSAELNAEGQRLVLATNSNEQMELFVRRVIAHEGLRLRDEAVLKEMLPYYDGRCDSQDFDTLVKELRDGKSRTAACGGQWLEAGTWF
jgi:hypothetical protein